MKAVERHETIPAGLVTVMTQPAYLTDECWKLRTTGHPSPPRARCDGHCAYRLVSLSAEMDVWRCARCLNFLVARELRAVDIPDQVHALLEQAEASMPDGDGQGSLF